jgi:2-polyprenyl-3-methyl-5-hydroxy-6-metoxy-1,4-benzoquinol methylase
MCHTLVYLKDIPLEQFLVKDDETDYYGKKYWLEHQQDAFGYPEIHTRARNDLTDRNLHWLKTLLKYCLPPAKVLELGCSHGSFVALMGQAGYDASGLEMSPWVVEFGQKTFGIPVAVGPIENLDIAPGSLDVIVLMDVLEHLPDPVTTMSNCLKVLKPDGLILLQTPKFKDAINYSELVETKDRFQEMLIPDEHLYLFSENSVTQLFKQLGAEYIQFEPAIFAHYDMFFAVSRVPLKANTSEQIETALLATPKGRLALALLDLRERELALTRKQQELESHSTARGEQVESLTVMLKESDADRTARGEQVESLTVMLKESDADRSARWVQIETLTSLVNEAQTDLLALTKQIETLTEINQQLEVDQTVRNEEAQLVLADLQTLFERRGFRALTRFTDWPEVNNLIKRVGKPNE